MKVTSVNVSDIQSLSYRGKSVATGIFKRPVAGRVRVQALGLIGDRQADLENHGGESQAVYVYPAEHYAYWAKDLGRSDVSPGMFGENVTVEGMTEEQVHVGDVFRIGTAEVQITQARTRCAVISN